MKVLISSGSLNSHLVIANLSGIESAAITLASTHVGLCSLHIYFTSPSARGHVDVELA